MPAPELVAAVHRLGVDYRTAAGVATALDEVEATFEHGRLSVIAGPSGSGKSTLLRVLAGLHRPQRGSVHVAGVELTRLSRGGRRRLRRRALGVVLQNPADNLVEHLTAREQLELAARLRGADAAEAPALLATVGLAQRLDATPAELSGGEQQRVAFAAGAIGAPRLLLADEPTAQLDAASSVGLIGAMRALVDAGGTLIVSSHDPAVIDAADRTLHLRDGRVVGA